MLHKVFFSSYTQYVHTEEHTQVAWSGSTSMNIKLGRQTKVETQWFVYQSSGSHHYDLYILIEKVWAANKANSKSDSFNHFSLFTSFASFLSKVKQIFTNFLKGRLGQFFWSWQSHSTHWSVWFGSALLFWGNRSLDQGIACGQSA
jgi:hypothetical protein